MVIATLALLCGLAFTPLVNATEEQPVRISGRVALADGAGLPGAQFLLTVRSGTTQGLEPAAERITRFASNDDGSFVIEFDRLPHCECSLDMRVPGYSFREWSWYELLSGQTIELGDITLLPEARARLRLVDSAGEPLTSSWNVEALRVDQERLQAVPSAVSIDQRTSEFTVIGLPAGKVWFRAYSDEFGLLETTIQATRGETVEAVVEVESLQLSTSILVFIDRSGFRRRSFEFEVVRLTDANGQTFEPILLRGSDSAVCFASLASGDYSLNIEQPGFEAWTQPLVQVGDCVTATLRPTSALELLVLDDETGEPIPHFELIAQTAENYLRNKFTRLKREDEPPPLNNRFELPNDNYDFGVVAAGYRTERIDSTSLLPGETHTMTLRLRPVHTLHGRVVRADGVTPVGGGVVQLDAVGADPEFCHPVMGGAGFEPPYRSTFVADDGTFQLDGVSGEHSVHLFQHAYLRAAIDSVSLSQRDDEPPLVIALPETVDLEVQLVGGPLEQVAGLHVFARPQIEDVTWMMLLDGMGCSSTIDDQGRFTIRGLPLVETEFRFQDPNWSNATNSHGTERPCFTLDVNSSMSKVEVDARNEWPASVTVQLDYLGERPGFYSCALVNAVNFWSGNLHHLDADGRAVLRGMKPDHYNLFLRPGSEHWAAQLGEPIRLAPGEHRVVQFDTPIHAGRVRVVDAATGKPVGAVKLKLQLASPFPFEGTYRTSPEGWLSVELPPGTFEFQIPHNVNERGSFAGTLVWTADGPAEAELKMTRLE